MIITVVLSLLWNGWISDYWKIFHVSCAGFFFSFFFRYQVKLPVASYLLETWCIDNFYLLKN